ncbi:MAG TPA: HAMP domain-containing sensor histidine kinase [Mycobacteriales bacterium]|nr:HAMP domain-containing sensor histidine kinase [Mycobacteriales bacterium]
MRGLLDGLSLRARLVAGVVGLVAVGLVVAGAAAASALRSYQLERVDAQLAEAATSPVLRADHGTDGPGPRGRGPRGRLPGELYRALLDGDGDVVVEPDSGRRDEPDLPALTPVESRERGLEPFTVPSAGDDGTWRAVAVPVTYGGAEATLVLASDLGEVDGVVRRLVVLQLLIGAVVLAGVTVLGSVVVRSSLRGLVEVEQAARAVAGGQLDSRVPERHPSTEVGRLGASFNRMVSQVQGAFASREASEQRLRRFVADASHELRTPLTSIRGYAELHRQGAVTEPEEVSRLLRRIEDEAVRMGVLVEDLLTLARLDEQRPLHLEDVDLTGLAADAVHDAAAVQPQRQVGLDAPGPVAVRGDEARLRQVLGNLLSNAYQHTPPNTPVEVRVKADDRGAVLEVVDRGPGMDEQTAARVFERFYRADASRTRASGGSGLGLSIVAALVQAHGGTVELDTAPGRGATFRVVLPT